jgi:DNA-binding transcriptional ArsR family regulator
VSGSETAATATVTSADVDLRPPELVCLLGVDLAGGGDTVVGKQTVYDALAERPVDVPARRVREHLDALAEAGLVDVTPHDGTRKAVELTDRGARVLEATGFRPGGEW